MKCSMNLLVIAGCCLLILLLASSEMSADVGLQFVVLGVLCHLKHQESTIKYDKDPINGNHVLIERLGGYLDNFYDF